MKVIIAGSRTFNDYELLRTKMDVILKNVKEPIEILSGGQRTYDWGTGEFFGADYLGERYAGEKGYKLSVHPAD